jgi:hypothetical protein
VAALISASVVGRAAGWAALPLAAGADALFELMFEFGRTGREVGAELAGDAPDPVEALPADTAGVTVPARNGVTIFAPAPCGVTASAPDGGGALAAATAEGTPINVNAATLQAAAMLLLSGYIFILPSRYRSR